MSFGLLICCNLVNMVSLGCCKGGDACLSQAFRSRGQAPSGYYIFLPPQVLVTTL